MRAICLNCEHTFSIPPEVAGQVVKCPKCKKPVAVPETRSIARFLLAVIISAALVGAIGFGLGVLSSRHSKNETQANLTAMQGEVEQKTAQLGEAHQKIIQLTNEIKQLQTQVEQLKDEVREAWVAKQKAERELDKIQQLGKKLTAIADLESKKGRRKIDWKDVGFPNFWDIPNKGKVEPLTKMAPGNYGRVLESNILQILEPDEMLINAKFMHFEPLSPGSTTGTLTEARQIIRVKGYSTKKLVDGVRWPSDITYGEEGSAEIAIIGTWAYTTTAGGRKTVLTAIPLDFIRKGLTEAEFEQLLK